MTRQRTVASYEPVFGGIVATLAFGLFCFLLFNLSSPNTPHSGVVYLMVMSGSSIAWGVRQIVGYRQARRDNIPLSPPLLGSAIGCVLIGLLMILVTVLMHLFSSHTYYVAFSGVAAMLLLSVGTVIGVRQGAWRNT